jgi:hypothetical protein
MRWLVTYILTQSSRTGLREPDALWAGSCLQDLLGARVLPAALQSRSARPPG